MATLLGFDYGSHKIGVAVGQTLTQSANPLTTLGNRRGKPDWERIGTLIEEWQPDALVVGHPFEMTDREANNAEPAKRFARQLHGRYHLPVHLIDERLTTRAAWLDLGAEAARDPTRVDAWAAKLILETWLRQ
ncbi:Holliday junction resolvase RuvX [endosymbiont of unidentified scaly snail isolate Monju]|uniref:Holliday junction resolvase RuvX n=1 Tax=endosymbiont of unidentified scaly snail isolate Monju TaxID=1248727 RepID=UPI0003892CBC|nr:Holliday junction resolvase RuvX [endosymbiont of unidentified scaly snail isolate Monju]BAN69769.1 putative holliday junction resolvase [endosymbiont of unidentified scaly snail isolate Monju]